MAMESTLIQYTYGVSILPPNRGNTNIVSIQLKTFFEAFLHDQQHGIAFGLGLFPSPPPPYSNFTLQPRNFTPRHITQLLHHLVPDVSLRQYLTHKIVNKAENTRRPSSQTPLFMSLLLNITKRVHFVVSTTPPPPSMAASRDVFQRLEEEQRVELCELNEQEACSICIEKLCGSETSDHESVIQLPGCNHMFHQDCIFEWLRLKNSCPLCRQVPYDEDENHQEIE